jgi:hypothetical protein
MPFKHVDAHFRQFLHVLEFETQERTDAEGKAERVARSLFAKYYPGRLIFDPSCYRIVGSYGKGTAVRPRTDIDMIFVLPPETREQIEGIQNNKQSYLLQEVKRALLVTFPNTDICGDGPVVVAPFSTYKVEIVPCFDVGNGVLLNAHTKNDGFWAYSNPIAELNDLNRVDAASGGKARALCRMLKAWKEHCNIDMRSVCLEIAAVVFVDQWQFKEKPLSVFYDLMVSDFFAFLLNYVNGRAKPAGIDEWIDLGNSWEIKARKAHANALLATQYENADEDFSAVAQFQEIFGPQFQYTRLSSLLAGILG